MGRISKQILVQLHNRNKQNYTLISFDIINVYYSITQELVLDALKYTTMNSITTPEEIYIIMHACARKSVLFNANQPWVKKNK